MFPYMYMADTCYDMYMHTHRHTHTLCCIESKGSCPHSIKYELYLTNN